MALESDRDVALVAAGAVVLAFALAAFVYAVWHYHRKDAKDIIPFDDDAFDDAIMVPTVVSHPQPPPDTKPPSQRKEPFAAPTRTMTGPASPTPAAASHSVEPDGTYDIPAMIPRTRSPQHPRPPGAVGAAVARPDLVSPTSWLPTPRPSLPGRRFPNSDPRVSISWVDDVDVQKTLPVVASVPSRRVSVAGGNAILAGEPVPPADTLTTETIPLGDGAGSEETVAGQEQHASGKGLELGREFASPTETDFHGDLDASRVGHDDDQGRQTQVEDTRMSPAVSHAVGGDTASAILHDNQGNGTTDSAATVSEAGSVHDDTSPVSPAVASSPQFLTDPPACSTPLPDDASSDLDDSFSVGSPSNRLDRMPTLDKVALNAARREALAEDRRRRLADEHAAAESERARAAAEELGRILEEERMRKEAEEAKKYSGIEEAQKRLEALTFSFTFDMGDDEDVSSDQASSTRTKRSASVDSTASRQTSNSRRGRWSFTKRNPRKSYSPRAAQQSQDDRIHHMTRSSRSNSLTRSEQPSTGSLDPFHRDRRTDAGDAGVSALNPSESSHSPTPSHATVTTHDGVGSLGPGAGVSPRRLRANPPSEHGSTRHTEGLRDDDACLAPNHAHRGHIESAPPTVG
eukprot:m.179796 g.179796  ORF g.179796 m.179796 type:complete len:632 (+) comp14858_c0_seq1:305-2200(+)